HFRFSCKHLRQFHPPITGFLCQRRASSPLGWSGGVRAPDTGARTLSCAWVQHSLTSPRLLPREVTVIGGDRPPHPVCPVEPNAGRGVAAASRGASPSPAGV